MIAFIIGLIAMIIIIIIGVSCLFIVDKLGVEITILIVMICIMSYTLGNFILDAF